MNVDRKLSLALSAGVLSALLTGLMLVSCSPDSSTSAANDDAARAANEAARSAALASGEAVEDLVAANDALMLRVEELESRLAREADGSRASEPVSTVRYETYRAPVREVETDSDYRAVDYVERTTVDRTTPVTYEAPSSRWDDGYDDREVETYEERTVSTDVPVRDDGWRTRTADLRDVPRPRDSVEDRDRYRDDRYREDTRRSEPTYRRLVVEPGTKISVRLLDTVSTRYSHAGDPVRARLSNDLLADNGRVAISSGADVWGHVTEVRKNQRIGGRPALAIALDRIELPDGSTAPLAAAWSTRGKSQTAKDAATIGGATVGGAVLGRILDKGDGDVIGGILGAAAGTAVAHQKVGKPIVLGNGATLRMTLRAPIEVRVRNS